MKFKLIFIISIVAVIALAILTIRLNFRGKDQSNKQSYLTSPTLTLPTNIFTFLLLGSAGAKHEGAFLTDTILLVRIDTKSKIAHLISIPRDLWVQPNEGSYTKINTLYQKDRFNKNKIHNNLSADTQMVRFTVTDITDIPINRIMLLNFDGFEKIIDLLDGIDVNVNKPFEDKEYPLEGKESDTCGKTDQDFEDALKVVTSQAQLAFPCRYETLTFEKGIVHMDGKIALKYARSRHGAGEEGDFSRNKRQQYILEAIKNKLFSPSIVTKLIPLFDTFQKYVLTDLQSSDITKLLQETPFIKQYTVSTLELNINNVLVTDNSDDGQYILVPKSGVGNWDEVRRFTKNFISAPSATLSK